MAVTLINVFMVRADKEEEFRRNWQKSADTFSATPGFIETHLHRNTGVGNQTFQYINIARWVSADAWHDSHAAYPPTEYQIEGVKGHPAIFENVVDKYKNDAHPPTEGDSPMYETIFAKAAVAESQP